MRPTVLLFQTNPQKTLSVRILAQKLGLRVLAAAPRAAGSPARGHPRADAGEGSGEPLPGEMLVMAGLNGKITDLFLQGLRRAHAGVALKAVLTPTSSAWTPRALYAELQREHEAMAAGKTAHPQN